MADVPRILTPKQIKERINHLKGQRGTWEEHWQELADYMQPRKNTITTKYEQGEKRNIQIVDSTGQQSAELLAGALQSLLFNPMGQWFEMYTGDFDLDQDEDVREWLQDSAIRMHVVMNNSNFQTENHETTMDLVVFGTGPLCVEEDDEFIVRFAAKFIGEVFICENNLGIVDEIYRKWDWTARNIVQEFGAKGLTKKILDAFDKNSDELFCVAQAIYASNIKNPNIVNKKYVSQYILFDDEKEILVKGFNEFPWVVPRWSKATGETYGRSPAMTALPEVKTINLMDETVIKGAQRAIAPPLQAPDDGFIMPIDTRPDSISYYRSGSGEKLEPVFNDTRVDFGFQILSERRQRIREAFFVDQLQLNQGPQMTATEVLQRTEEKMRLLGPFLGRMQHEYLRPLVDRVFSICLKRGVFKPVPRALEGQKLSVRYTSTIARTQRLSEANNIIRAMQVLTPFVTADPSILDNISGDGIFSNVSQIFNFPQTAIRPKAEVEDIRENRAQAQAQEAQAVSQARQADVASKMGSVLAVANQQKAG